MRNYLVYFIVIILFIGALLGWVADTRIDDFKQNHIAIASETTSSVNEAVARFISERRRLVYVFAETNRELLNSIIATPDDDLLHQDLVERLSLFFPNYFAYSISDEQGAPLFEDFDGLVGAQCKAELQEFAITRKHLPRVHPNFEMYHFDVMVPFEAGSKKYVFFLSFDADLIAAIVRNSSIPDHQLVLVTPVNDRKLIEVTTEGSRVHLNRDDFRMTKEEETRVLVEKHVDGTAWHILDLISPSVFEKFSSKIFWVSGFVFLIFIAICILWFRNIRAAEILRLETDRQKEEFLSTVSHELRTPLTAIKGSIGLLAGTGKNFSDAESKLVQLAASNTERLIRIVNDLLDVQKIESGKFTLEIERANLSELVQQSVDSMRDYGRQFNVQYEILDLEPDRIVNVDSSRLIQVLNNLLSNATKYGSHNDIVDVSIISHDEKVRVCITDRGKGIPDEFKKDVFSKFSQAKSNNDKKVESSGLGLYIVSQIVSLMGAQIDFFSSENGTTFFIDLN